ncbi:MAG: hypothetical protein EOM26_00915 [Alphaproteobacteria bacterium]|nr:hypothetical protein [Alphaproteobacteria bacterium]
MRSLLIAVFLSVLSTCPALAQDAEPVQEPVDYRLQIYGKPEIVQELMALESESQHAAVIERVRAIENGEDMKEALLWLRTRVMADDTPDPRYALLYAESLQRIIGDQAEDQQPLMETAAMVYLYGHLTMAVDAQRCLNREASWSIISPLISPFDSLVLFYKDLSEEKRRDILAVAMRLEDRVSGREPNAWICVNDREAGPEIRKAGDGGFEDELFSLVQEFELQPQYISERIWSERRDARRRAFARQFR